MWPFSKKESKTGPVIFTGRNEAKWGKRNFKAFADEAYSKNVVAFQAIHKTAQAVATIPWYSKRPNGDILTESPFLRLIENPNRMQSRYEFLQALVGFYRIAGNGYIEKTMVQGAPRELYTLRPDRMKVKPSRTGIPSGYVYTVGQKEVSFDSDPITGQSDIRHLKDFNPLDDWYGMSPIEAGAYAVDQHNESMTWMQSLLQNGAAPSGALEVSADTTLGDDEYHRLKAEIEEKYAGSNNAGRPLLLEGGMKWTAMGLSPQSMSIIETKYSAARDISLALGVPPLLLNIPGDSTYSNYQEARLAFYEETVIPLAHYIRDELNAWLSDSFQGVMLDIDLDQIPAIADKRMKLWDMANASGDLTINEKREMKGYDPVEGGDVVYIPQGNIPLTFDISPVSTDEAQKAYGIKQSFDPPKGVQDAAQQGLDYRNEYGRGGTEVGIARARDLSNGRSVSAETIGRMVSFFARHEENRVPPSEETEPDGGPTNGWIAWLLWGGDAGRTWSSRIQRQIESDADTDGE